MQSVPVWVPIVVGIIGLAGVLATQWITAVRDNRRWKLEHGREVERRAHEDRKELRSQRIELYSRYLAVHREWYLKVLFGRLFAIVDGNMDGLNRDEINALHTSVVEARAMIDLVGSDRVIALVRSTYDSVLAAHRVVMKLNVGLEEVRKSDVFSSDQHEVQMKILLAAFRMDLGTTGEAMVEQVGASNPSQPSDLTS